MENENKKPSNPKAFPTRVSGEDPARPDISGMDLRDYFAAKTMQAIISTWKSTPSLGGDEDYVSKESYKMADAMLKQREQ